MSVNEALVMPVPANLALSDAAAIPEVWLTAYQLLHLLAGVKSRDCVLVHAAGSGVGTAAIQLAKLAGARALATAGSQEKLDMAEKMGAEGTANYKNEDFSEMVLKKTNGNFSTILLLLLLLLLLLNEVFPERIFQYLFTKRIVILKLKFLFTAFI